MNPNRVLYDITHTNAYTNNTFNLNETEKSIIETCNNSFNYLINLQRSYISIYRFNLTEQDVYTNHNNKICVTVNKDFIHFNLRSKYKNSDFYNKYISFETLLNHPEIFTFIPLIKIDGKILTSFEIKSALDGTTNILLNHIRMTRTFLSEKHDISVAFIENATIKSFSISSQLIENYEWKIPSYVSNIKLNSDILSFMFLTNHGSALGSDLYPIKIDNDGSILIDNNNSFISNIIKNATSKVTIHIVSIPNLYEISGNKNIFKRIDDGNLSSITTIFSNDNDTYEMPIPSQNLFILKINKETGETTYENNRDVILHYPNIYEIMSNDCDDSSLYEYKIYYFYYDAHDSFKYKNKLKYIYMFLSDKIGKDIENTINDLLYSKIEDEVIQNYFFDIFNYQEHDYVYNHGDFYNKNYPYDFDYKIEKMREFVSVNPDTLESYGKSVSTPFSTFYLYTKNINLDNRLRDNTHFEAVDPEDLIEFDEPHYLFILQNESRNLLNLRFFIDGVFYPNPVHFNVDLTDYIYIPASIITKNSYIEIEKFHEYKYSKEVTFNTIDSYVDLDFSTNPLILPTLHDLYVSNINGDKIDRSKFKLYAVINTNQYDVSDQINQLSQTISILLDDEHIIDEDGNICILLDDFYDEESSVLWLEDPVYINPETDRLPLKYMVLDKLRIFCTSESMCGNKYLFNIDKTPHIINTVVTSHYTPRIPIYNLHHSYNDKSTYMRTFINGKYIPLEYQVINDNDTDVVVPKCYVDPGDIITIDITPFSYTPVYQCDEIPEDFVVDMKNSLDKPFNLYYYDIYLNGKKLSDNNLQVITPNKIKIFNVHSRNNLYVYKRDRDYEYYGNNNTISTTIGDFLNSEVIPQEYKNKLIDIIIHDTHDDFIEGDNTESDINGRYYLDDISSEEYDFYFDIIIPKKITRPNSFLMSELTIKTYYPAIYEQYSNHNNRLVIRPNIGYDSRHLLMIGKKCDGIITI